MAAKRGTGHSIYSRREAVLATLALGAAFVGGQGRARAQPAARVWKLAWVTNARAEARMFPVQVVRQRLSEEGYVEGVNLEFQLFRAADRSWESLAAAAHQAVAWAPNVIHVSTSPVARVVAKVTSTIPIVFARVSDPVETGLLADPVRPGGNITGVAVHQGVLTIKRLELVRELLPGARRVAFLLDRSMRIFSEKSIEEMRDSARRLGLSLVEIDPSTLAGDLPGAFENAAAARPDAVVLAAIFNRTSQGGRVRAESELQLEFEQREAIPVIGGAAEQVERGQLIALGSSYTHEFGLVASQVVRIFQGAVPATMPVEWVHNIELAINLRAAKRMGIAVPKSLLVRADKVVQ